MTAMAMSMAADRHGSSWVLTPDPQHKERELIRYGMWALETPKSPPVALQQGHTS